MKKATVELFTRIFSVLKPPPNMTLSQWADEYRVLPQGTSALPGKWNTKNAPYQREIMNAITDISVQKVVIMSGAQIGKTDAFVLNPIGYYMHYDPAPIIVMQPTITMAEGFSKEKLSPMIRAMPVLRERVNEKSRNSGNTILSKIFPGGQVTIVGANSPSSLRMRPIRILLADEIDAYPPTAGNEGDPLVLAGKRLTTYWNKKEVDISTPTIKGISRIEVEYEHSTQEVWNVPCPECGELQPLVWAGVIFDKENPDEISYCCQKCGVLSSEAEWKERFIDGKFIAKYPERKVRGFHLNALASPFAEWKEIVVKFLTANEEKKKGNIELLKAWTNTEMGQTWEEEGEQIEETDLLNRLEPYGCEVPDDVLVLTAGIDTQDDRFEIEVVGWGVGKESWGILYAQIYGDLKQPEIWAELDAFLLRTFAKRDGTRLRILAACMDSGGHFTNQVYKFCKQRATRRIFAVRGGTNPAAPYVPNPTRNNREKAPLFVINVDTGKSLLYQRLQVEKPGPGYCHFPMEEDEEKKRGYDETYFKGLTAEKMIMSYKKGRAYYVWTLKDSGYKRNEPLDIRNYATVALEIANPPLEKPKGTDGAAPPTKKRGRRKLSGGVI